MARLVKKRSQKANLPPGSLIHVGEVPAERPKVSVIDYGPTSCLEHSLEDVEQATKYRHSPTVTWVNVDGVHETGLVGKLGETFVLHPLVMEDIVNTDQRPKLEDFGSYVYIVVKMIRWNSQAEQVDVEQVSLVLGDNFVLTFQERPGDVFEAIRDRIRKGRGRIRQARGDYLVYALIDAIVDGYFLVLETIGDRIETIEEELVSHPENTTLKTIHRLKREALLLRRAVWPLREVIGNFERSDSKLISETIAPYSRDLYDHTIQVMDTLESLREMLSGMVDVYLSSLSNRMNEVMKVLTIIATIFIPITFVAGVYGMNFESMPELGWGWAYPWAFYGLVLVILAGLLTYFRKRRWL